jgi:hypothetical protein
VPVTVSSSRSTRVKTKEMGRVDGDDDGKYRESEPDQSALLGFGQQQ